MPPRPTRRRGIFFDVENTSRAADISRVVSHLALDWQGWTTEFLAVGNWRVIGHDTARLLAQPSLKSSFKRPMIWVDLFILVTLLFPEQLANFGFLRVLRLWTLVESEFFWRTVGRRYDGTRVEEVTKAAIGLLTFVFVITGFVYSTFMGRHDGIDGWVDALYFTITSLTTTGYGDITLPGVWGRLLSIFVMLVGVSLFIRLMQLLVRPHKVIFPCPECGLRRHDPDAVHCKACGKTLCIPDDGL